MPLRWEEKNALIQQKLQKEDKQGSRSLSHSQGGPSPATLNSQVTFLVSSELPDQKLDIRVNVNLKPNGVYVFAQDLSSRHATAREQVKIKPWLRQCAVAMNLTFT